MQSSPSGPTDHNPEVNQVQTASRTGNRMHAVVPLAIIVIWLTIVFLYFRL